MVYHFYDVIFRFFKELLTLSEQLILSSVKDAMCAEFGERIYLGCFRYFGTYHRQEIIAAILAHLGSGCLQEINSALRVLCTLVDDDYSLVQPFSAFLRTAFDYLDFMNLPQIRQLFQIFSCLCIHLVSAAMILKIIR